jgi:hypothetical protein
MFVSEKNARQRGAGGREDGRVAVVEEIDWLASAAPQGHDGSQGGRAWNDDAHSAGA